MTSDEYQQKYDEHPAKATASTRSRLTADHYSAIWTK